MSDPISDSGGQTHPSSVGPRNPGQAESSDSRTGTSDLGKPVIEHRARRPQRLVNTVLAAVGLGLGGLSLAIGIVRYDFALGNYGPAVVWRWSGIWLVTGAVLALLGAIGGIWLLRWSRTAVVVHDGGLELRRGRRSRQLPWSAIRSIQVSGVRYRSVWGSRSSLELETADGRHIRLSDTLAGLSQLAATIKRNVYPRLLTEYTRFLRDGQPVPFGQLVLSSDGVARGSRRLAWAEVASADLQNGRITIRPASDHGGPLKVDARRVPNPEICLQLVRHYASGGARG